MLEHPGNDIISTELLTLASCFTIVVFDRRCAYFSFFFFNDTATTEIYTLSLHDALPISTHPSGTLVLISGPRARESGIASGPGCLGPGFRPNVAVGRSVALAYSIFLGARIRSEEHTSELQSHSDLVCRLLLEKKKTPTSSPPYPSRRARASADAPATRPCSCSGRGNCAVTRPDNPPPMPREASAPGPRRPLPNLPRRRRPLPPVLLILTTALWIVFVIIPG